MSINRTYQIPVLYEKTRLQAKLKQFNRALQSLEKAYDTDPDNKFNKQEYEKRRQEILKLMKLPYFASLKHHHIKNPYVIMISITKYTNFGLFS